MNILERHGARFPAASAGKKIQASVAKLANATSFAEEVAFVKDYAYDLGADDLNPFGAYQSYEHGKVHWSRYGHLKAEHGKGFAVPFIRSDSSQRVVDSAGNWSEGFSFHKHQVAQPTSVIIDNASGSNDTLDDNNCDSAPDLSAYEDTWQDIAMATPTARLNALAPGANLSAADALNLLELCGFESLYDQKLSKWCSLFTAQEFEDFECMSLPLSAGARVRKVPS